MAHGRAIYPPGGGGTGGADGYNIIAAGTQTANTTGTVVFSNSNGITFGMSNNSVITASVAGVGGGNTGSISAGTTRGTLGEMVFSNSNGLSFGINGQTLTGSHNGLTSQSNQAFSASGGSSAFQTLSFNNANGATFSNVGGAVQLSYTVPSTAGLLSAINFSAGTTSNNSASIQFVNSNGVSFGLNAGTITATVATNYLTSQSNQAFSASGGSSTFQTLNFVNGNGATFTNNAGSVGISYTVPNVPAQTNQTIGIYGSSQTTGQSSSSTFDARSITIRGAGIVSVGNSAGEIIISATGAGGGGGGVAVSAGANSVSNGTVVFSNSNGVTFGLNGATVTASHDGLTSQSNQAFSASGGSSAFQTLNFANSNGLIFSNSNGSVIGSYTVPSTAGLISAINFSAGTTSNNTASIQFANSNGVSFGLNAGTITATVATNYLTSQSNQAFSASGGSSTFQTLSFANSNGLTFSNSNGSVIVSYTVPVVPAQTNQTIGAYAVSNTTGASSSTTIDARSLSFEGAGIASVGYSNGSVIFSVPAGGGGGDGVNILAAGTQTANTTGTVLFQNSNGVTFGMSNNSVITASVAAGGGGGTTVSQWRPYESNSWASQVLNQVSQPMFAPFHLPNHLRMDRAIHFVSVSISSSSNSSAAGVMSFSVGIYTRNASSLSLVASGSQFYRWTNSSNLSTSVISGIRAVTIPFTDTTLTPGDYWFCIQSRTSSTNANWFSMRNICVNGGNTAFSGHWGSATNNTFQPVLGFGLGPQSASLPDVIPFSSITVGANIVQRSQPIVNFAYSTV